MEINASTRIYYKNKTRALALALVGTGLRTLGILGFFLLPRPYAADSDTSSAIPVDVDYPAPGLNLSDLSGNPVALTDHLGQVVLVNNWATWCPPCKAEMPTLQSYFEQHQDQGFTIIAIDAGDPSLEVADFVKSYGLTFPIWLDPTLKATAAFRNPGLPSSYVIDRRGTVRLAWAGAVSQQILEKYVTPILEE